jgi:ABC-2 type transport system ATP-binding protein
VKKDNVVGFLGPNGAGKTTVMKVLTGYHYPTSGEVSIDGLSVQEHPVEIKRLIGYLPENAPLYGDLYPGEYLNFAAASRLIPPGSRRAAVDRAVEICGLGEALRKPIETLSKGYRQRLGLAQAVLHDPPILILDEPSSGLDPNQIIEIRSLIRELGKSKTVILSTHILNEVEAVCSQVLILNEGRIAAQGSPAEIAGAIKGGDSWRLSLKGKSPAEIEALLPALGPGVRPGSIRDCGGGRTELQFFYGDEAALSDGEAVFDWAVSSGLKILGMSRETLSLEDIFVRLTTET